MLYKKTLLHKNAACSKYPTNDALKSNFSPNISAQYMLDNT